LKEIEQININNIKIDDTYKFSNYFKYENNINSIKQKIIKIEDIYLFIINDIVYIYSVIFQLFNKDFDGNYFNYPYCEMRFDIH
jgi:hypothetical protein